MRSTAAFLVAVAVAVSVVTARPAVLNAQPAEVAVSPPPSPPPPAWLGEPPPDDEVRRLDERTALTLGARKLKIGILAFGYGITDWLDVGVDPPYWALKAFSSVLVPNGHVKLVALRRSGLWVAGNVGVYYASLTKDDEASGHLLSVPLSLFVSVRATEKLWIHPAATYTFANLWGTGDFGRMTFEGAANTRAFQLGLMFQYQLTKVVALTMWGRYQPYTGTASFDGTGAAGDGASATVDGRLTPGILHPWAVVPGVALMWKHVRLVVGAGYGNYFLPGMDIAIRGLGFVPDASLYVVL